MRLRTKNAEPHLLPRNHKEPTRRMPIWRVRFYQKVKTHPVYDHIIRLRRKIYFIIGIIWKQLSICQYDEKDGETFKFSPSRL